MSVSPASLIAATVSNFKPDASTYAGGGASLLTFLLGCALVGAGVAIPPIAILGLHIAAIPITMTMVAAVAPVVGHVVSAYVPPTYNQQINQFATKIGADVESVKAFIPQIQDSYPGTDGNPPTNVNNITSKG